MRDQRRLVATSTKDATRTKEIPRVSETRQYYEFGYDSMPCKRFEAGGTRGEISRVAESRVAERKVRRRRDAPRARMGLQWIESEREFDIE